VTPDSTPAASQFSSGGDVGRLLRRKDWSKTPLGPIDEWPQPLTSALSICLGAATPLAIYWGSDLVLLYNDLFREMLADKHPDALGSPGREVFPEIWDKLAPLFERVHSSAEATSIEAQRLNLFRHGRLEETYFDYTLNPILDADGGVAGVFNIPLETTAAVLAQRAARENERRQTFLIEMGDRLREIADPRQLGAVAAGMLGEHLSADRVGYAEVEENGDYFTVEHDWTAHDMPTLVGRHRLEAFGKALIDELRAGRTTRLQDALGDTLTQGEDVAKAFQAAGTRSAITVPLIKRGQFTAAFYVHQKEPRAWTDTEVALTEEIAERTWEALERARADEALREREKHFRLATEVAQLGTWTYEVESNLFHLDARMRSMIGVPADTEHLSLDDLFERIHPDDRERVMATIESALEPQGLDIYETDFRLIGSNGKERWVSANGLAQFSAAERGTGLFGTALDVTERRRLAQELLAADRAKDEFLAMLGHELRNPLSPMTLALELMQLREPDALVEERAMLERQVDHLGALVADLLDISRITRGKVELERTRHDFGDIVAEALETASPLFDGRDQHVVTALGDDLAVAGDKRRLIQVVTNLLTNASKYSPEGSRIEISAGAEGDDVVFRVRDEGVGIGPELLATIFELFEQGDQEIERAQGGLGLGLAIVKNLVEMHHGSVEAHSEGRDQGSEFVVRLPRLSDQPEHDDSSRHQQPAAVPADDGSNYKVLIVDDNVDAAESLSHLLEAWGHQVCTAHDGATALELAAEFQPDLALVDIGLPVLDGFEVARRLRQMPELELRGLVALTGYGQDNVRKRAFEAGFGEHLVKPARPAQLQELIESFTETR
jgi:PAS domain S-box-containing protein